MILERGLDALAMALVLIGVLFIGIYVGLSLDGWIHKYSVWRFRKLYKRMLESSNIILLDKVEGIDRLFKDGKENNGEEK